ncbi:C1 family peptidase [Hazenella coriacea]|uniref:Papain like protease n=1 Tax=Hazenella coriacea TaxID=1179467 RepID=A0A4R3LGP8_9BACL|nr:C1 family peptidase [Hazenella coriacea]TCS96686.1 papain like protease [Hazenella coriacea]
MAKVKGLGFIPSPEDKRDLIMSAFLPTFTIPRQKDYTDQMSPVRDQGTEGTCVGFATVVGVKEYQAEKDFHSFIPLSPRFLYQKCKEIDGNPDQEGTYPRIAMQVLKKTGVCLEEYWPYMAKQPGQPKPGAEENANRYRIKAFAKLDSVETMKRSLVANGPFLAGVPVYQNWMTQEVHATGKIPLPGNDNQIGGHAICIVGYNDDTQLFKFKNSWGDSWGDHGYGYLPYEYLELKLSEAWSATDLIDNPDALVNVKKEILQKLGEDFGGAERGEDFQTKQQTITYH